MLITVKLVTYCYCPTVLKWLADGNIYMSIVKYLHNQVSHTFHKAAYAPSLLIHMPVWHSATLASPSLEA